MAQNLITVVKSSHRDFEDEVNEYLEAGYTVSSTCISRSEAGDYNETPVYHAILVKSDSGDDPAKFK